VRRRPALLVIASVGLALTLAHGLPVGAQEEAQDPTPGSSTTLSLPVDTNPTTSSTFVDTTSTSEGSTTTTTSSTTLPLVTTTTERRSVVTLPPTTSTTQVEEPIGPPSLPTTTSTPTPREFDDGLSAGSIAALVIAALLAVALGLSVFLWWYLRRTAPVVAEGVSGTPG